MLQNSSIEQFLSKRLFFILLGLRMEANRNKDMKMKELDTKEIEMVSGGFDGWEQLGIGIAMIGLGIAIVGTAGLATVPITLAGAATLGEIGIGAVGVGLAGAGGFAAGSSLTSTSDDKKESTTLDE